MGNNFKYQIGGCGCGCGDCCLVAEDVAGSDVQDYIDRYFQFNSGGVVAVLSKKIIDDYDAEIQKDLINESEIQFFPYEEGNKSATKLFFINNTNNLGLEVGLQKFNSNETYTTNTNGVVNGSGLLKDVSSFQDGSFIIFGMPSSHIQITRASGSNPPRANFYNAVIKCDVYNVAHTKHIYIATKGDGVASSSGLIGLENTVYGEVKNITYEENGYVFTVLFDIELKYNLPKTIYLGNVKKPSLTGSTESFDIKEDEFIARYIKINKYTYNGNLGVLYPITGFPSATSLSDDKSVLFYNGTLDNLPNGIDNDDGFIDSRWIISRRGYIGDSSNIVDNFPSVSINNDGTFELSDTDIKMSVKYRIDYYNNNAIRGITESAKNAILNGIENSSISFNIYFENECVVTDAYFVDRTKKDGTHKMCNGFN